MKKIIFSLILACSLINANDASQFELVMKVNGMMQTISQKLVQQIISAPARSSIALTHEEYTRKMKQALEDEVAAIIDNKNQDELTQEEKDIIQMLEIYIAQLEMYYPENPQT